VSNEIYHSYEEANILYALVWRKTDDAVYDVVAASDTFVTYTDTDIDRYDLVMTNQADSDYYSVDFPVDISAGVYRVQILLQNGASIDADADVVIAHGEIHWDGTAEITLSTIDTSIDTLTTEQSKTLNIYGPGE